MPDRGSVVFLPNSPYELGELAGTLTVGVLGAALATKAVLSSRVTPLRAEAPSFQNAPPAQIPAAVPASTNDDFFFAPSSPSTPRSVGPIAQVATTPRWQARSVIMLVIGVALVLLTVGRVYVHYLSPGASIEMPDKLLGMDRVDPDSALGKQLDASRQQMSGIDVRDLQVAGYGDVDQFVMVIGGGVNGDSSDADEFFSGATTGLPRDQFDPLSVEDAGTAGGEMRCTAAKRQPFAICAWIGDQVVGAVFLTGPAATDYAGTAREIRRQVEH